MVTTLGEVNMPITTIPIKKCPECGEDMDIKTYRGSMCGHPHNYYELIWYCECYELQGMYCNERVLVRFD